MRHVLGVIVGYICIGVLVFGLFTLAWLVLGAEGSFQPASWKPSMMWIIVTFIVDLVSGFAGGFVAAKIGKSQKTLYFLIGFMILMTILLIAMTAREQVADAVRPENISMNDAMSQAEEPLWLSIANVVIGGVAVLFGGKIALSKLSSSEIQTVTSE